MSSARRSWAAFAAVLLAATAASQSPRNLGDDMTNAGGKLGPAASETSYALCFGDGTGAPCPAGHFGALGRGCENSLEAGGAFLATHGEASVSSDSFSLHVDGIPRRTSVLFLQGTKLSNGGAGRPFGDGLLCLGGSVLKLGVCRVNDGSCVFPPVTAQGCSASISMLGGIPARGGTRDYQALYRDNRPAGTRANFNLTNAWVQVWTP